MREPVEVVPSVLEALPGKGRLFPAYGRLFLMFRPRLVWRDGMGEIPRDAFRGGGETRELLEALRVEDPGSLGKTPCVPSSLNTADNL